MRNNSQFHDCKKCDCIILQCWGLGRIWNVWLIKRSASAVMLVWCGVASLSLLAGVQSVSAVSTSPTQHGCFYNVILSPRQQAARDSLIPPLSALITCLWWCSCHNDSVQCSGIIAYIYISDVEKVMIKGKSFFSVKIDIKK